MRRAERIKLVRSVTKEEVNDAVFTLKSHWQFMNSEEFEKELVMTSCSFNERLTELKIDKEQMIFQVGRLNGFLEAMTMIQEYEFNIECLEKSVKSKQMMHRILAYLYKEKTRYVSAAEIMVSIYNPMSDCDFAELMLTLAKYGIVVISCFDDTKCYKISIQGVHYYLTHKGDYDI